MPRYVLILFCLLFSSTIFANEVTCTLSAWIEKQPKINFPPQVKYPPVKVIVSKDAQFLDYDINLVMKYGYSITIWEAELKQNHMVEHKRTDINKMVGKKVTSITLNPTGNVGQHSRIIASALSGSGSIALYFKRPIWNTPTEKLAGYEIDPEFKLECVGI